MQREGGRVQKFLEDAYGRRIAMVCGMQMASYLKVDKGSPAARAPGRPTTMLVGVFVGDDGLHQRLRG